MKLVFYKSREFPIGHITTSKDGQKMKKVGPGKWVPVSGGKPSGQDKPGQSGKSISGLTFKDGFYFDGKTKISNDYDKAKKYSEKKQDQPGQSGSPGKSIKIGDKIRVKAHAKSSGGVREHKGRGIIATVKEIAGDVVKIIDDTGKMFQVKRMALEFAKSGIISVNDFNLIKSKEDQLKVGIKIESEHKDLVKKIRSQLKKYGTIKLTDKEIYKIIAKVHLKENPNYYKLLQKYIEPETHKSKELIFNLNKSRPTKYIKRIPKSGGGYKYIYKEDQKNNKLVNKEQDVKSKFKKWFRNSKIVDEKGNPKKIFHGTSSNFENFIPASDNYGNPKAIYFSDSKVNAKKYGPEIKEVFVKMENPFEIDMEGESYHTDKGYYKYIDAIKEAENEGYDGVIAKNMIDTKEPDQKGKPATVYVVFDEKNIKEIKKTNINKSINLTFNLFKADLNKLDQIKKILLKILDKNMEKSLTLGMFDLFKSKAYPIGTKREWRGKKFIKVAKGKWRRFYEGESRGQKQSLGYIKKKIENAKSISELAKIVLENRKRFTNPDGSIHNVVKQLLELAKGQGDKKGRGKDKQKRKDKEVVGKPEITTFDKIKKDQEADKAESKQDSYIPTPKEKKVIETNEKLQLKTAIEIDEKIAIGEDVSELRNGENYYNEKPAEILNTGTEVYGAARHKYDTYEVSSLNLQQMEKDGMAEKIITKNNLLQEPNLNNFDDRVKNGEGADRILLENVIYKLLRQSPGNMSMHRGNYNEFCRILNRGLNETQTAKELYSLLVVSTQKYADEAKKQGGSTFLGFESVGKELLFFLHPKDYEFLTWYSTGGRSFDKNSLKLMTSALGAIKSSEGLNELKVKKIFFGEKAVLEAKGIGKIKKGDKVKMKPGFIESIYRTKAEFESDEKRIMFEKEMEKVSEKIKKDIEEEHNKLYEKAKGTEDYKKYKKMHESDAKKQIDYWKNKYIKKDGSLSANGKKRHINMKGFKSSMQSIKDQYQKRIKDYSIRSQLRSEGKSDYLSGEEERAIYKARLKLRGKYMIFKKIKPVTEEIIIGTARKNDFRAVITFEDGKRYEKTFSYDDVDSLVEPSLKTTKGKTRKIDFYVESKVERKGGTKEYEDKNSSELQKELHGEFKLKSTTFGNSMPDKERAFHLKKTAEAFSDLSDLLKLDKNVVSANGKLGIAYGAFGGLSERGALAAYHPDQRIITLTRKKGFGSFAHEWAHFVDNMLGGGRINKFASTGTGLMRRVDIVPETIPNGSILTTGKRGRTGKITKTKYYYDKDKNPNYPFIKLGKGQVKPSGKDSGRYKFYDRSLRSMIKDSPELNTLEVPDMTGINKIDNERQRVISSIALKMQIDLKEKQDHAEKTMSEDDFNFYRKFVFNDYYYSPDECFARAFEVYISDKFQKMNRENTYLASQKKTKKGDGQYVYPQADSARKEIYDMFENLFDDLRKSDDLKKSIDKIFGPKLIFKI